MSHEKQGTGYDSGAAGHELQGRKSEPQRVLCCNCERDCSRNHFMCDRDDGQFCPECWEKTACSQGVHGEGCPTQVFSDGKD